MYKALILAHNPSHSFLTYSFPSCSTPGLSFSLIIFPLAFLPLLSAAGQSTRTFTMHASSITQLVALALLTTPLVSGLGGAPPADLERRYVVRARLNTLNGSSNLP